MNQKRVMIFIDGSNLYHTLKNLNLPTNIDFRHLIKVIVGDDRELVRVYYYNAGPRQGDVSPDQYDQQWRFFEELRDIPYFEMRLVHLEHRPYGLVEKGADVMMAVDMVVYGGRDLFDVAVVVSADSDFKSALQYIKEMGKHVELAFPAAGKSYNLRQVCDRFIPLTEEHLRRRQDVNGASQNRDKSPSSAAVAAAANRSRQPERERSSSPAHPSARTRQPQPNQRQTQQHSRAQEVSRQQPKKPSASEGRKSENAPPEPRRKPTPRKKPAPAPKPKE